MHDVSSQPANARCASTSMAARTSLDERTARRPSALAAATTISPRSFASDAETCA
jgi:hypothetical protein